MDCYICENKKVSELGRSYPIHPDAVDESPDEFKYLCDSCLSDVSVICTCFKELNEPPNILAVSCGCKHPDECIIRYSIGNVSPLFVNLLKKWSKDHFIINGCRGCQHSKELIEKNYDIAQKSAITACVYKKVDVLNDAGQPSYYMKYSGDALDDGFITYAKSKGFLNGQSESLSSDA